MPLTPDNNFFITVSKESFKSSIFPIVSLKLLILLHVTFDKPSNLNFCSEYNNENLSS